jgi:hypothetical protein
MKHYGLNLAEGSEIVNITIPTGTTFPQNDNVGELFFRTDQNKFYVRDNVGWVSGVAGINSIVEDTTPQLGGDLDTNGFNIVVATGDVISISDAPTSPFSATNKQYVDQTIPALSINSLSEDTLPVLGGSLNTNGFNINATLGSVINISEPPTADTHAVNKSYADSITFTPASYFFSSF